MNESKNGTAVQFRNSIDILQRYCQYCIKITFYRTDTCTCICWTVAWKYIVNEGTNTRFKQQFLEPHWTFGPVYSTNTWDRTKFSWTKEPKEKCNTCWTREQKKPESFLLPGRPSTLSSFMYLDLCDFLNSKHTFKWLVSIKIVKLKLKTGQWNIVHSSVM